MNTIYCVEVVGTGATRNFLIKAESAEHAGYQIACAHDDPDGLNINVIELDNLLEHNDNLMELKLVG